MLENFDRKTENVCYAVINIGALLFFLSAWLIRIFQVDLHQAFPLCGFYRLTGYYCPGCGGTRALVALLHLHILQSLRCHPLILYTAVILGVFWVGKTLEIVIGRQQRRIRLKPLYLYLALAVVLIQWILKNGLLYARGIGIEAVF